MKIEMKLFRFWKSQGQDSALREWAPYTDTPAAPPPAVSVSIHPEARESWPSVALPARAVLGFTGVAGWSLQRLSETCSWGKFGKGGWTDAGGSTITKTIEAPAGRRGVHVPPKARLVTHHCSGVHPGMHPHRIPGGGGGTPSQLAPLSEQDQEVGMRMASLDVAMLPRGSERERRGCGGAVNWRGSTAFACLLRRLANENYSPPPSMSRASYSSLLGLGTVLSDDLRLLS